jgi:hypothetical protein
LVMRLPQVWPLLTHRPSDTLPLVAFRPQLGHQLLDFSRSNVTWRRLPERPISQPEQLTYRPSDTQPLVVSRPRPDHRLPKSSQTNLAQRETPTTFVTTNLSIRAAGEITRQRTLGRNIMKTEKKTQDSRKLKL